MKASFCNMIAALYCYCGDKLIQYGLLLKHSLQKKGSNNIAIRKHLRVMVDFKNDVLQLSRGIKNIH